MYNRYINRKYKLVRLDFQDSFLTQTLQENGMTQNMLSLAEISPYQQKIVLIRKMTKNSINKKNYKKMFC